MTIVYVTITSLTKDPRKIRSKKTTNSTKEAIMLRINLLLTLIITVLFVYPSVAQENTQAQAPQLTEKQRVEMAITNYKKALESDNLGMIESAIINVMKLKHRYPVYDYSSLVEPLAALENTDKGESIKFMSYIVKNYLQHPDRYAWIEKAQLKFDKDLYAVIAEKVADQVENQ